MRIQHLLILITTVLVILSTTLTTAQHNEFSITPIDSYWVQAVQPGPTPSTLTSTLTTEYSIRIPLFTIEEAEIKAKNEHGTFAHFFNFTHSYNNLPFSARLTKTVATMYNHNDTPLLFLDEQDEDDVNDESELFILRKELVVDSSKTSSSSKVQFNPLVVRITSLTQFNVDWNRIKAEKRQYERWLAKKSQNSSSLSSYQPSRRINRDQNRFDDEDNRNWTSIQFTMKILSTFHHSGKTFPDNWSKFNRIFVKPRSDSGQTLASNYPLLREFYSGSGPTPYLSEDFQFSYVHFNNEGGENGDFAKNPETLRERFITHRSDIFTIGGEPHDNDSIKTHADLVHEEYIHHAISTDEDYSITNDVDEEQSVDTTSTLERTNSTTHATQDQNSITEVHLPLREVKEENAKRSKPILVVRTQDGWEDEVTVENDQIDDNELQKPVGSDSSDTFGATDIVIKESDDQQRDETQADRRDDEIQPEQTDSDRKSPTTVSGPLTKEEFDAVSVHHEDTQGSEADKLNQDTKTEKQQNDKDLVEIEKNSPPPPPAPSKTRLADKQLADSPSQVKKTIKEQVQEKLVKSKTVPALTTKLQQHNRNGSTKDDERKGSSGFKTRNNASKNANNISDQIHSPQPLTLSQLASKLTQQPPTTPENTPDQQTVHMEQEIQSNKMQSGSIFNQLSPFIPFIAGVSLLVVGFAIFMIYKQCFGRSRNQPSIFDNQSSVSSSWLHSSHKLSNPKIASKLSQFDHEEDAKLLPQFSALQQSLPTSSPLYTKPSTTTNYTQNAYSPSYTATATHSAVIQTIATTPQPFNHSLSSPIAPLSKVFAANYSKATMVPFPNPYRATNSPNSPAISSTTPTTAPPSAPSPNRPTPFSPQAYFATIASPLVKVQQINESSLVSSRRSPFHQTPSFSASIIPDNDSNDPFSTIVNNGQGDVENKSVG